MATSNLGKVISATAEADLSAKQFHFVKVGAAANGIVACGNGELALGVLQDKPVSGVAGSVALPGGVTQVVFGDTVAVGGEVASDAAGKAVPAVSTDRILGQAIRGGASGERGEISLYIGHIKA